MISILRKRIIPVCLALMILATTSACGSKKDEASNPSTSDPSGTAVTEGSTDQKIDIWGKYSPEIEITTVKSITPDVAAIKVPEGQTWDNNPWSEVYKKDFGINYKVTWAVPQTQYEQKLGVAIASNQLPDITAVNAVQLKKIIDSDMATDMTQIYQDYISPASRIFIEGDGGMALKQSTFDGKLMALPLSQGNSDHPAVLFIRKDWLDNLGLQAPKTVDELAKISEAFTKQDPNKNGKADTYGFALSKELYGTGNYELTGLLASFGANTGWIRDSSGKLVNGSILPETKTALTALAKMYQNKEIDQEFGVKDAGKVNESVVSGKVGMFYGAQWTPFSPIPDAIKNDPKADWRAYPIPSVDGSPAKVPVGLSTNTFYVVNKNCKNPEAAVKLLNATTKYDPFWAPDYDPIYHHGSKDPTNPTQPMPGVTNIGWQYAAIACFSPTQNIDIYNDNLTLLKTDGDISKTKMSQNSRKEDGQATALRMKLERQLGYIPYPESKERFDYKKPDGTIENKPVFTADVYPGHLWASATFGPWAVINDYFLNKQIVQPEYYGSSTDTMTSKGPTLDKMRVEIFTKIIMGAGADDEFEKFVDNWKKLGGDKMTQEVNEWDKAK